MSGVSEETTICLTNAKMASHSPEVTTLRSPITPDQPKAAIVFSVCLESCMPEKRWLTEPGRGGLGSTRCADGQTRDRHGTQTGDAGWKGGSDRSVVGG